MRSAPVFGATFIAIVAVVLPLAPDTIDSQSLSLVAPQAQPLSVVRTTANGPPVYPIPSLVLLSEYRHGAAA